MEYDVVVIGAGAAGLMAAGTAAEKGARVLLAEKMEKAGRKIRITGKGRCNLTNTRPRSEFLAKIRSGSDFLAPAFDAFDNRATIAFFERIGLKVVEERGGRVFPASGRAADVAEALAAWCRSKGVTVRYNLPVAEIAVGNGRVAGIVTASGERIGARSVVIATGGLSYPLTGSTGDGYTMAHALGHPIEEVRPSLTPLECSAPSGLWKLDGVVLRNISVRLLINGLPAGEEFGEIEFVDFAKGRGEPAEIRTRTRACGVGGAITLRLSRAAVDALIEDRRVELSLDLKPALDAATIAARLEREADGAGDAAGLLRKVLPREMVPFVAAEAGIPLRQPARGADTRQLARALKDFRLAVSDYRPFTEAVVTAGGVDLHEIDPATMASRLVAGLFFAGEVLDIDGDTGGYNLQVAFSTGRLAGESAVRTELK